MTKTDTTATMTIKYGIRRCRQCGQMFEATQDVPTACGECGSTEWSKHGPKCPKLAGCCEDHHVFMGDD